MSRLIRVIRLALGWGIVAWVIWQLIDAWRRPLLGFMPWGDPTGLRISAMNASETAAARAREEALGRRWEEDLTSPRNV